MANTNFPKLQFSHASLDLSLATKTISCFPRNGMFISLIFNKMPVRYPTLNNHGLSVVSTDKNVVPWEKQLSQFSVHPHAFSSSRQPSDCAMQRECLRYRSVQISSVQFSRSVVSNSATPWIAAHQDSLSITNSRSLLKLMPIESVMPSSHLILCRPLLLLSPIPPRIRVFPNESTLFMRWPKYWRFSFSISPSNEHPGLISFRMDWLDLLAVQGTRKSLLQHHSSKASIFWCSAFFTVQPSHPYMTTGKSIALTRWTFVGKVMSLFFNMLSRLVINFLPRSKRLLISWL